MQSSFFFHNSDRILADIDERLAEKFGRPHRAPLLDPISQLVWGILSGRTYTHVTQESLQVLRTRFGTWEAVRDAPVREIEHAISSVTFADVKAPRLKSALEQITGLFGRLTLTPLLDKTDSEALYWLEQLPGVGRKASAATLNFSMMRRRTLVIDTHHLRILKRLRLVRQNADLAEAYDRIMPALPKAWSAEDLDAHHQMMKLLGQTTCRHGLPQCRSCPLKDLCPTGTASGQGKDRPAVTQSRQADPSRRRQARG
ncbi:endonuclease III domain-containing protein [Aestuariibius insulae]|uniref:endonuclease III domain-containing protein n=1 Tax=Aestuariibius insulae TaxID=2058287 RepID=UPI00345ED5ED